LAFETRNWKRKNRKAATPAKLRVVLCLAALAVLCFSCLPSLRQSADVPLTELHGTLDPLRNTFNKDVGKVRLMLLLDPT